MNKVFVISIIVVLLLSQTSYFLNMLSNLSDDKAGVYLYEPQGYVNLYDPVSKDLRAFIEVIFAGLIFYSVFKLKLNNVAASLSIFLLFSTANQLVDRFFNPYKFGTNEAVFLILAVITSIWILIGWKIHTPSFGKD